MDPDETGHVPDNSVTDTVFSAARTYIRTLVPTLCKMVSLDISEKAEFKRSGFLTLRKLVDPETIEDAREEVWNALPYERTQESLLDSPTRIEDAWDRIEDPEPFGAILEEIFPYAEALVGEGILAEPGERMQIAPRFPEGEDRQGPDAPRVRDLHPHVDGYGADYDKDEDQVYPFSVGATVYLNDVVPRGGGFTVWPGSYWETARYYAENHFESLGHVHNSGIPGDVGDPFEIDGPAGTVVFWHNKLCHTGGVNRSTEARLAAITRFRREDHREIMLDAADKPWKYWPGMEGVRIEDARSG